jgi:hypothetical protein
MSGVLKSIGKVFKKVVTSKIFKIAAIAAAVYFTGGLAAAAMGSEFAMGLPMIGEAAGALGIGGAGAAGAVTSAAGMASIEGSMMTGLAGAVEGGSPFIAGAGGVGSAAAGAGNAFAPTVMQAAGGAVTPSGVSNGVSAVSKIATGNPFNLSDSAMKILGNGIATGGKAMVDAIGQKAALDQRQHEIDTARADVSKKGSMFDMSNTYRKPYQPINTNTGNGVVNAVGGP